jgi:hypothetical protein
MHWLSCLLSSSWTWFVQFWRATSLRWRRGQGCIDRRCNGGWPGIRLISRRGWRTGCIGQARAGRRSPWPVGATHGMGAFALTSRCG